MNTPTTDNTARKLQKAPQYRFSSSHSEKLLGKYLDILANPDQNSNYCTIVKQNPVRTVWRCDFDDGCFYLKQFHPSSWLKRLCWSIKGSDALWELKISRHLIENGANAQQVMLAGSHGNVSWIVTKAIDNAEMLCGLREKILAPTNSQSKQQKRRWISATAALLAKMHNCGVLHLDLHSGNIMLDSEKSGATKPEPIICDLHRTRLLKKPRRLATAKDIARLDHDLGRFLSRSDRLRFLNKYLQARKNPRGTLRGWAMVCQHLRELHNCKFLKARDKRIRKNNSYYARFTLPYAGLVSAVLKSKTKNKLLPESSMSFSRKGWKGVLDNIDMLLDKDSGKVFKDSPSALVIRKELQIDGNSLTVFIKHARNKKKWKFLLDALRKSRSRRAFERSHELLQRGITTAFPLAYCEKRDFRLLRHNILITADFHNSHSASDFVDNHCNSAGLKIKRQALKQAAKLIRKMHDAGYTHRDLKASNVLVRQADNNSAEIALIDMDGLCKTRFLGLDKRLANMARFLASLQNCRGFSQEDQNFFVEQYLGSDGLRVIDIKLCNALMAPAISHKRNSGNNKREM